MVGDLVHLELHTPNLGQACSFYSRLLGWRPERAKASGTAYQVLDRACALGVGVVECGTERSLWLPYVEVADVLAETQCACELGASVLLEPRPGPCGWRSVVRTAAGGEIALWQLPAA